MDNDYTGDDLNDYENNNILSIKYGGGNEKKEYDENYNYSLIILYNIINKFLLKDIKLPLYDLNIKKSDKYFKIIEKN